MYIHKRNIIRNNKNTKVKNIFTKDFLESKKKKGTFYKSFFFTKVNNILQKLEIFEKARNFFQKLKTFYRSLKEKTYYISKKKSFFHNIICIYQHVYITCIFIVHKIVYIKCILCLAIDGEPGKRHSLIEAWRPMTKDIKVNYNIHTYIYLIHF